MPRPVTAAPPARRPARSPWRSGLAALLVAGLAAAVMAGTPASASPAPAVPAGPATLLPTLGSTPTAWSDGRSPAALMGRALALLDTGRRSAPLRSRIAAAQVRLDADSVTVRRDRDAATAADVSAARAAAAEASARSAYDMLAGLLEQHAVSLYMGQGAGVGPIGPGARSADQLTVAAAYLDSAVGPGGVLAARSSALASAAYAADAAAADRADAAARVARARAAQADERATSARLQADLLSLDSADAAVVDADHAALTAQAGQQLSGPSALQFTPPAPLPAPLPTTATALAWAFAELGTPYLWGGTGPEFDCSGLTQYVWRQAGVSIPRVAADQDAWTDPVPLAQLTPGDLVFYGTTDIHHVGIYIGDGLMINAPHTGTSVQVSSIWWSDLAGFGRVHADGTPVASHRLPTASDPAPVAVTTARRVPSQPGPALPPRHRSGSAPAPRHRRPSRRSTASTGPATAPTTTGGAVTVPTTTTGRGAPGGS